MKPSNHSPDEACVTLTDLKASLTALHTRLLFQLREMRSNEDESWAIREDGAGIGSNRDNWVCRFGQYVSVEQALNFIGELENKSAHRRPSGGVE